MLLIFAQGLDIDKLQSSTMGGARKVIETMFENLCARIKIKVAQTQRKTTKTGYKIARSCPTA